KNLDSPRPRLMYIANSKDVQVKGLHFKDSAFWNLHIYKCQQVLVENLDIRAGERSPSTDGIDIDSSQYVTIKGCFIFNNDDTIALKGTKGPLADKDTDSPPVEHIRISDCTFARGGAFVTCGSEATIVRDVIVENCRSVAPGPTTLLRLKMRTDTPQNYSDIHFRNIEIGTAGTLIGVAPWTQYFDLQGHPQPSRSAKNITYTNIKGTVRSIGNIGGGPGDTFEDFKFENIDIQSGSTNANWGAIKGLVVKNFKVNGQEWTGPTPATRPAGR
ncbi:MAG: glycosyl hydrolase family 28 protein, partial [Acidobacteriota bacterium]